MCSETQKHKPVQSIKLEPSSDSVCSTRRDDTYRIDQGQLAVLGVRPLGPTNGMLITETGILHPMLVDRMENNFAPTNNTLKAKLSICYSSQGSINKAAVWCARELEQTATAVANESA